MMNQKYYNNKNKNKNRKGRKSTWEDAVVEVDNLVDCIQVYAAMNISKEN